VIASVLGAPGSGKRTAAQLLASLLPGHVVLDRDVLGGSRPMKVDPINIDL
jgi:adenylate kinase family enzyme